MPNFCANCGARLDADARFCSSCNAPAGVAGAGTSEIPSMFNVGSARVAVEPPRQVPPFIWAAALQMYWLLNGIWGIVTGGFLLGVGLMGASGAMRYGYPAGGSAGERILILMAVSFLAGALDACVSTVLVYGLLTLKTWAHGVFMVWLPVKIVLWILTFAMSMSVTWTTIEPRPSQPALVTIIIVLGVVLQFSALLAGFLLVRRGKAALV
jgi:zinc-ribbon domain